MSNYNDNIEWVYEGIGSLLAKLYERYGKEAGVVLRNKLISEKFGTGTNVIKTWTSGPLKGESVTPYTIFQFINSRPYEWPSWNDMASPGVVDNVNILFRSLRSLLGKKVFDELDLPAAPFKQLKFPPTYEFIRGYGMLYSREISDTMWEHFYRMKTAEVPTNAFTEDMFNFIRRVYKCDLYRYSIFLHYMVDGYFFRLSKGSRTSMVITNGYNFKWYNPTYSMYHKIIASA